MKYLTPVEQYLIDYIIADNEETESPNPITPYMQALNGDFKPNMPFFLSSAEPVLYVPEDKGEVSEQFKIRCGLIKKQFLEIADFILYLVQKGYVRTINKEPETPPDIADQWRTYTDFSVSEGKSLAFAASLRLVPRLEVLGSTDSGTSTKDGTMLTRIQREVINHLIAENEGKPWGSKISKYFYAFSGKFLPEIPFTFYFVSTARPIMYVYDPQSGEKRSSRAAFHAECDRKKKRIQEITGFFRELTEQGYVRRYYRGLRGRQELPAHYDTVWRKYSDFYSNMMSELAFVCLADFTPKLKLYKLWKSQSH